MDNNVEELTLDEAKQIVLASAHCKVADATCGGCIFFADTRCATISATVPNELEIAALDIVERSIDCI